MKFMDLCFTQAELV